MQLIRVLFLITVFYPKGVFGQAYEDDEIYIAAKKSPEFGSDLVDPFGWGLLID